MEGMSKVVLIIDKASGAWSKYLQGIADYARLNGPWVFFASPPFYLQNHAGKIERLDAIKKWGADGIITLDVEDLSILETLKIPMIVSSTVSIERFNFPYVDTDNPAIGKMAADYFIKKGFRNFAYCGFDSLPWSVGRGRAFEKYIKKAGFDVHFYHKSLDDKQVFWEAQYAELADWLKSLPKPIAVLACNDDRGGQVLDACRISDIKVPQQVAVLGVDNDVLACSLPFCQLSSVDVNFTKAGWDAAETLSKLMAGKKSKIKEIIASPISIVTRQSTDILAIADSDVALAVNYITAKIKTDIQINDICEYMHIPRSTLCKKFIDSLGCTVHDVITKMRIEEISRVIIGTNIPISKIAVMFNFSSPKHISRYFSKQIGISPLEFRRHHQYKFSNS